MSGIGEQIAAAREKRGITAAEAARRLHIRSEFIAAMDSENWSRLGPPAYARGFVKNYARLVGIDPKSIVDQLDAALPLQAPDTGNAFVASPEAELQAEPLSRPMRVERLPSRPAWYPYLVGAMSMLAAALVFAVLYYTFGPSPREQVQAQAPAQSDSVNPSPAPQDAAIFNGGNAGALSGQKAGVDLQLQLTQDSWLSVTVDGKRVVYETLPAGTVRDFHGVREITLRAGNAGGVNATIDGRSLGSLGQHGQVEERSFAAKPPAPSIGPRE